MSNNNVAVISLMAKFDEKSVEQAAKKLGKTTEEALSDIGQDKFGENIVNEFNKAMDIIKKKLKGVNLSSYTNNVLDSLFSKKDIEEKTKDLQNFISNITNLSKSLSGLGNSALNSMSTKQLDSIISKQKKVLEKEEEIAKKRKELESTARNIGNKSRNSSTISKNYLQSNYEQSYKSLEKLFSTEKGFTSEQQKSIKYLSEMLTLYSDMGKVEPGKGTSESIKYASDLLTVVKEINKVSKDIDLFTNGKASKFVNKNFDSTKKVNEYNPKLAQQDFVKAGLSTLNAQKAKLEKDLTEYISKSIEKNLEKITNNAEQSIDKANQKAEKLKNTIDELHSSTGNKPIIGKIVDDSQVKSLEEIEDRLLDLQDKYLEVDKNGYAVNDLDTKELKEFIDLYNEYNSLLPKDNKFESDLPDTYKSIIDSDDELKKYADNVQKINKEKQKLAETEVKSNTETNTSKYTEDLKDQQQQIEKTEQAQKDLQETQKATSDTIINVDTAQALSNIKAVKESLESLPSEKNIKISVNNTDYSSVPLLSNEEGKTVNMFRGVKNAWSGLVNDKGIGFFTDKLELAVDYADELAKDGKVIQANLSLHNPLEVEGNGARWDQIDFEGVKQKTDDIIEKAKQLGYDGVIFKNIRDGFTDAESDLSNVVAVFDAMSVKNEQVIGTVKAGTGELTKIESTANSMTDAVVESQEKVQSELKETQVQAENTAKAVKDITSAPQESNISSENSIVESQNKIQEELKETQVEVEKTTSKYQGLLNAAQEKIKNDSFGYYSNDIGYEALTDFQWVESAKRANFVEPFEENYEKLSNSIDKIESDFRQSVISFDEAIDQLVEAYKKYDSATNTHVADFDFLNNKQSNLNETILDTATAYEKMTEAEKEARKSAIQAAVNSIPQAENTARYVHWGNTDQSKSILSNPNGMSTGDYGLISSFADCLGEAETSMEAIYKYWDSLHAEGFDKGSALVIDIPLDEVKEFERGLKDNIPQEYIKGFVDTESNAITLNTILQNGLKETAEQAEKTAQSVQDISKTQIKDVSSNISSRNSIIEDQNKIQEEIKETRESLHLLSDEYGNLIYANRGVNHTIGAGLNSNRYHGGTFWTISKELAANYGSKIEVANLSMNKPFEIDNKGYNWDEIELYYNQLEELKKYVEKVKSKTEEIQIAISNIADPEEDFKLPTFDIDNEGNILSFGENSIEYIDSIEKLRDALWGCVDLGDPKIQQSITNLYDCLQTYARMNQLLNKGELNTNEVVEIAKNLGYDGVIFKNIMDGSDEVTDIFVTLEQNQVHYVETLDNIAIKEELAKSKAEKIANSRKELYNNLKNLSNSDLNTIISDFQIGVVPNIWEEFLSTQDFNDSFDNIKANLLKYVSDLKSEFSENLSKIDSPMKDVFQGEAEKSGMDAIASATEEAVQSKKDFATANEGVQSSIDGSKSPLQLEAELMEQVAKSAREAADAKKEFIEANKQVKDSDDGSNSENKQKDKYAKNNKVSEENFLNDSNKYSSIVDKQLNNSNYAILGKTVNTELINGLIKVTAKIKDADGVWKSFSAKVDADGNIFEQRFKTITKNVDKLETELKKTKDSEKFSFDEKGNQKYWDGRFKETVSSIGKCNDELARMNQYYKDIEKEQENLNSQFSKMYEGVTKYNNQFAELSKRKTSDSSDDFINNLNTYQIALNQYLTELDRLHNNPDLINEENISNLKKLKNEVDNCSNAFKGLNKGASEISRDKLIVRIADYMDKNTAMTKKFKTQLEGLIAELKSMGANADVSNIADQFFKVQQEIKAAGQEGKKFWDIILEKAKYGLAAQIGMYFGFNDIVRYAQQAISTIVDLDDALLDLKKTTSMSSTELNNFYYSANDVAKQMGVTTKSIIEQASAWSRLGYSSNEQATEMAKLSSKFASISPGMDTDQAQEGMVSIMKAWQINPEDVEKEILDPINQLGNKFAESNDDIVEGMKRSAAALAAVGTDYKDAYSLFTGVQEVLQNSEVAGRALRSISMRIRGYDENSEDGFEQTDDELKNITGDLIDLTKTAQHAQGVSIFKEGSTTEFKSLVDYFGEIHDIWNEMSQKQQNDFLQKAFGKTQAQSGAALIQNYDAVKEALAEIDKSADSADKEMSTVEQTLSYKINALKETWVGCAQQILDRGDLGIAISGLNGVSKVITGLIDNVGLLKTAAMGVAAAFSFKNVGRDKMYSLSF